MRRQLFRRTLFVFAVAFTFTLVSPVADTMAKPGGGNSANAKACQKGGWETLAREESPTIAFQN